MTAIVDFSAAAEKLVNDLQKAIHERLSCPTAFEPYHSLKERRYPCYRIQVRNFTVFYVVIDNVMEVRRVLYSRRDWENMI